MTINEVKAQRAQKKAEKTAAKAQKARERANSHPSAPTPAPAPAPAPALVPLSQFFMDPNASFVPSATMQQQMAQIMSDKLKMVPVYTNDNGQVLMHEAFAELQQESEFPLQGTLSARYVGEDASGQIVILNDPSSIPPEEDIQRYLAFIIARGYQPLCAVTVTDPPAAPAPAPSNPQPNTEPPAEQAPPNFTELAAQDLGYAPGANLGSLTPKQLAALTKRADELRQEYEAKQAKQELYETIVDSLLAAADRVIEWSDKERQQAFMAKVDTLSRETEDDLSGYSEESRQLLELMDMMSQPTARKALTAAVNIPAFQQVLSALQPVAPVAPPQPPKNGGPLSGRALGRLLKSLECPNRLNHEDLLVRLSKLAQSNPEKLEEQLYRDDITILLSYEEWRGLLDEGGLQYDPEHDPFDEEEEGGGADG